MSQVRSRLGAAAGLSSLYRRQPRRREFASEMFVTASAAAAPFRSALASAGDGHSGHGVYDATQDEVAEAHGIPALEYGVKASGRSRATWVQLSLDRYTLAE